MKAKKYWMASGDFEFDPSAQISKKKFHGDDLRVLVQPLDEKSVEELRSKIIDAKQSVYPASYGLTVDEIFASIGLTAPRRAKRKSNTQPK